MISAWLAVWVVPSASASSFAFTATGERVRWGSDYSLRGDSPFLALAVHTVNQAGLTEEDVQLAVGAALLQWQGATGGAFSFALWHGTDPEQFVPSLREDGLSSVYFVSQDLEGLWLGAGQAGYTRLYFDGNTAEIYEIDLVINDVDFTLTTDPALATFGGGGLLGRTVYIPDVLTHELGHALGLGHAGGPEATMFFAAWADQRALACEDRHAVRDLYEVAAGADVHGVVTTESGRPVSGMRAELVSATTRQVAAGVLTLSDGTFVLRDLPADQYLLSIVPWTADDDTLDPYYAPTASHPCPTLAGRVFPGAGADGTLVPISLTDDETIDVGAVSVVCDGEPLVPLTLATAELDDAPVQAAGPGLFGWVAVHPDADEPRYYRLSGVMDHLSIDALSWSLLSPARTLLALYQVDGAPVPSATSTATLRTYPGGGIVWDARLEAESLTPGDYVLEVRVARLPDEVYPWPGLTDPAAFVLFVGSLDGEAPPPEPDCGSTEVGTVTWEEGPPLRRAAGCGCATRGSDSEGGTVALLALLLVVSVRRAVSSWMITSGPFDLLGLEHNYERIKWPDDFAGGGRLRQADPPVGERATRVVAISARRR